MVYVVDTRTPRSIRKMRLVEFTYILTHWTKVLERNKKKRFPVSRVDYVPVDTHWSSVCVYAYWRSNVEKKRRQSTYTPATRLEYSLCSHHTDTSNQKWKKKQKSFIRCENGIHAKSWIFFLYILFIWSLLLLLVSVYTAIAVVKTITTHAYRWIHAH